MSVGSLADEKLKGADLIRGRTVSSQDNPGHALDDYSPTMIMRQITGMSLSNEVSSVIVRAQRAGADVTVVE